MSKKITLCEIKRAQIVIWHKKRFSQRKICKKVSCGKMTVHQAIDRFQNCGLFVSSAVIFHLYALPLSISFLSLYHTSYYLRLLLPSFLEILTAITHPGTLIPLKSNYAKTFSNSNIFSWTKDSVSGG